MKQRWLRLTVGSIVVGIILIYGFTFILYEGNLAVVTRFGAPRMIIREAGLHFKLPWPFEKIYTFDRRKHCYDTSYIETLTKDKKNIIFQTYVVWSISDSLRFLQSTGDRKTAELNLDSLVINAKNGVLGRYNLSALVSTNPEELRLNEIEAEILTEVAQPALNRYGIKIFQVGLKRLGLPYANTRYVLDQMRAERLKYVEQLKAEGERDASLIRNEADVKVAGLKSEGMEKAAKIKGEAEFEAAKIYAAAHQQNPKFFSFLRKLDSTEKILGDKSILIFRSDSPPFDILDGKE